MFFNVTYAFQSDSTLYSCLNVKELLARSRREIWNVSDCNWTRIHSHLVRKRTLNHLAILKCGFWNVYVTRTYSQMYRADKCSQHSSNTIQPVWLIGRVFVYELSGSGLESSCSEFLACGKRVITLYFINRP